MPTRVSTPANVFPGSLEQVPAEVRVPYYHAGARYLIGGQVREWSGPCQEVFSPVCVNGPNGPQPYALGHYPLMTPTEALQALAAARQAYDNGCGAWPTMAVSDRIRHVEAFIPRTVPGRD